MAYRNKIIVTGGAGFIGSNLIKQLNKTGIKDIIVVDHINHKDKIKHLNQLNFNQYFDRDEFLSYLHSFQDVDALIHLGACTSTVEKNKTIFTRYNLNYSKTLFNYCTNQKIRFIYASSAATYGNGSLGFSDSTPNLKPLNLYGQSKYLFDRWLLSRQKKPKQWSGLKFFNVYGSNESHKNDMASMVYHGNNQINQTGMISLFKSYKKEYLDGGQMRDFVYVKDIVKVIMFFLKSNGKNGIFNVGTSQPRTFIDLANALFSARKLKPNIRFIDMPKGLKGKYQYFTKSDISKLRSAGFKHKFYSLEAGIKDYS